MMIMMIVVMMITTTGGDDNDNNDDTNNSNGYNDNNNDNKNNENNNNINISGRDIRRLTVDTPHKGKVMWSFRCFWSELEYAVESGAAISDTMTLHVTAL